MEEWPTVIGCKWNVGGVQGEVGRACVKTKWKIKCTGKLVREGMDISALVLAFSLNSLYKRPPPTRAPSSEVVQTSLASGRWIKTGVNSSCVVSSTYQGAAECTAPADSLWVRSQDKFACNRYRHERGRVTVPEELSAGAKGTELPAGRQEHPAAQLLRPPMCRQVPGSTPRCLHLRNVRWNPSVWCWELDHGHGSGG